MASRVPPAHDEPVQPPGLRCEDARVARSLLNHWSTVEIVAVFVIGSVVLAIAVSIAIRRLIPDIAERQFEDIASGLRVVYELLFALILAFVIASVLDKFNEADNTVGREATALAQMVRNDAAFPTGEQTVIDDSIKAYIDAVVNNEWKTMKEGRASPEAASALETMYGLYASFEPRGESARVFYNQAIDHLDEVATARRERLALSTAKLPTILVIMLPIGVILLLMLEYRPKLSPRSQAGFMGTLALVLSSTYLLTIVLDYPFSGDVSVGTDELRSGTLASFEPTVARAQQPGDVQLRLTPKGLSGVWHADAYGTVVLAQRGREVRGAYRIGKGTVRGTVSRGVFHGVWCESSRRPPDDAGLVEWRLIRTDDGDRLIAGTWSLGYARRPNGSFKSAGSWDLSRLRVDRAYDLVRRLDDDPPSRYCHAPAQR
jgi:hypothetical protein